MGQGTDRGYVRRLIIALAAAVALHEILAGFWPYSSRQESADTVVAQRVTIERRPTPKPTPTPQPVLRETPPPSPPPATPRPRPTIVWHATQAAAPKAAGPKTERRGGEAAPLHRIIVARRPTIVVPVTPAPSRVAAGTPVQNGRAVGIANGGAGTGAGPGTGTGGDNGASNGNGQGGSGNGTGSGADTSPCGYVDFVPDERRIKTLDDGSQHVEVRISVHLRNGETVEDYLHWPFVYASESDNPFRHKELPALLQFPPPGYNLEANQQPVTVFVVKHTGPNGRTTLPLCPGQKPDAT